jgi:hypothetical protein
MRTGQRIGPYIDVPYKRCLPICKLISSYTAVISGLLTNCLLLKGSSPGIDISLRRRYSTFIRSSDACRRRLPCTHVYYLYYICGIDYLVPDIYVRKEVDRYRVNIR